MQIIRFRVLVFTEIRVSILLHVPTESIRYLHSIIAQYEHSCIIIVSEGQKLYALPASAFECRSSSLMLMIAIPLAIVLLLGLAVAVALICWRHRLPAWLPWPRNDKTAPANSAHTKQQFLEKTYMMPGADYDGLYHSASLPSSIYKVFN